MRNPTELLTLEEPHRIQKVLQNLLMAALMGFKFTATYEEDAVTGNVEVSFSFNGKSGEKIL